MAESKSVTKIGLIDVLDIENIFPNSHERETIKSFLKLVQDSKITERIVIELTEAMCEDSTDPETFENWQKVKDMLVLNRKL